MGQNIPSSRFTRHDFAVFQERLRAETALLEQAFRNQAFSRRGQVGGFELEAWLVGADNSPKPCNTEFLARLGSQLVVPELAAFNIELNTRPQPLSGGALRTMHADLAATWARCREAAAADNTGVVMVGILPSAQEHELSIEHMSRVTRYRALNEQVLLLRGGAPLALEISGPQPIATSHYDVMLEAAATSFQIHLKVTPQTAVRLYNAAIISSGPMVAACANSPYLFAHELWDETRIPLFEQAVEVGDPNNRRVGFCSRYARGSLFECFEDNLQRYPVLLPIVSETDPEHFAHVRLHNGTIWRWNRPLIGFDDDGTPHLRIEHRVVPAGPTIIDSIANAALFFGLSQALAGLPEAPEWRLSFETARANFYAGARRGLAAEMTWLDGSTVNTRELLLAELLPMARGGLQQLGIDERDTADYLGIIEARLLSTQTGAHWQRRWVARHGADMQALTQAYIARQNAGAPVHEWDIEP